MPRVFAALILVGILSVPISSKVKVPNVQKCEAFTLEWPGAGDDFVHITGCKLGASLTVVQNGVLKFSTPIVGDNGGASFEKMGKLRFNKKKKRLELTFTAFEEAAEYEMPAKAVLYFDGKRWRVGCDQKSGCETLP